MNFKTVIFKLIKFKLSHSSPPSSSKCTDANTALNFLIKKFSDVNNSRFVNSPTVQHDHEQPITKSTNRLQLHCLPQCQNRSPQLPAVPIQQLPQCNRLLVLCEFKNYAVTSDATKCNFTNCKHLVKFANF